MAFVWEGNWHAFIKICNPSQLKIIEDFFYDSYFFSRSEPICVSKEIILSSYVLNNLPAC